MEFSVAELPAFECDRSGGDRSTLRLMLWNSLNTPQYVCISFPRPFNRPICPPYALDIHRYAPLWDWSTLNDFALSYSRSAPVIMASCTSPILSQVIATCDKHFEHSMRTIFMISNSIRHSFDIYMTYGPFIQVLLDRFMTSVSFSFHCSLFPQRYRCFLFPLHLASCFPMILFPF